MTATLPIAAFSEKYHNRKYPLISGQVILIASQIMLMEAPTYWVMVIARIVQGISSSMIWVVGLALMYVCSFFFHLLSLIRSCGGRCDTTPKQVVGSEPLRAGIRV